MMNLLARILSHGFGLVVVALLVIALIYRGELFPEWGMPDFLELDSAPDQAADAASGEVKRDGEQAAPGAVSDMKDVQEIAPDATPLVATDGATTGESVPAAVEPAPKMEEAKPGVTKESAGTVAGDGGATGESVPAAVEPAPKVEEAKPGVMKDSAGTAAGDGGAAGEAVPVPTPGGDKPAVDMGAETPSTQAAEAGQADEVPTPPGTSPPASDATAYRVLAAAREAYWLRDYALAEQKYQDLIALQPDNPDGYGELGNMYFSQGAWEQASAAYYEAGVRLADQGFIREARQLVEVIRGLNGTQADALAEKVQSAGSGDR